MYTPQGQLDTKSLLNRFTPLVRRIALQLKVKLPESVELDDLIQSGMVGLLDAHKRFDQSRGAAFSTFASQRIRGAMIDELRRHDWLPRSVRKAGREMDATIQKLEQRMGRPPEEREIAEAMGIAIEDYHKLLLDTNNGHLMAWEENDSDESDQEHEPFARPDAAAIDEELREQLIKHIDDLPEREKLLLSLYYQESLNLKEIGAVLEVSESRVCQLHSQAVARLRSKFS